MHKIKLISIISLLLGLLTCILPASPIFAGGDKEKNNVQIKVVYKDDHSLKLTMDGKISDKQAAINLLKAEYDRILLDYPYLNKNISNNSDTISPLIFEGTTELGNSNYKSCWGNYIHVMITDTVNSWVDWEGAHCEWNGDTFTWWGGATPYNVDKVTLTDRFTWYSLAGINISTTGGGFTVGSNYAQWEDYILNDWQNSHGYAGLDGESISLYKSKHVSTGTFRYGTSTQIVSTNVTMLL